MIQDSERTSPSAEGHVLVPCLLVLVSFLPNLRAAVPGLTYYFRDFTLTYYPLRRFFAHEISEGRWPFWNRYLHEGCAFLPVFYPFELLQVLWPGPATVSWLLTLHFPIAALACYALARDLGTSRWSAFGSGAVYAVGGLCLSCLNLHWFLQALALAPALVLTSRRAVTRGGTSIPLAGLALALSLSTLAVEFVAQALALGAALGLAVAPKRQAVTRLALTGAIGLGLAAVPISLMLGIIAESLRGAGLPTDNVFQNSLHPGLLLQALIPDLAGRIADPLQAWWGGRLYSGGSPYFLTMYVGPVAIALAVAGAGGFRDRTRGVLAVAAVLGCLYALGSHTGLAAMLHPLLTWFRFPVKALLTPYICLAVWVGFGIEKLRRGEAWRLAAIGSGLAAAVLATAGAIAVLGRESLAAWLAVSPRNAGIMTATLVPECLVGIAFGLTLAGLAVAIGIGRIHPARGGPMVLGLLVLDLWRGGVGVNPQTSTDFFDPAPALASLLGDVQDGRVFSLGVDASPAVRDLIEGHDPDVGRSSFLLTRRVLTPFTNLIDGIDVAEGSDRLSFVPTRPAIAPTEYSPETIGLILQRLRNAAVVRVVSLDPLQHSDLRLRGVIPAGPRDLRIRVYDLLNPWPRAYIACRERDASGGMAQILGPGFVPDRDVVLDHSVGLANCTAGLVIQRLALGDSETYDVDSMGTGYLVMRDSYTPSWTAAIDGRAATVVRANGWQRAVLLPGGRHRVSLRYAPPGLRGGALATVFASLLCLFTWRWPVLAEVDGRP